MLNLYISHVPEDRKYLTEFLEEIRPMQEKYNLRIWYNHPQPPPVVPFPWSLLFFWYRPRNIHGQLPFHYQLHDELKRTHLFLFFTSQQSIATRWVEEEEVRVAVERYREEGNAYVRVFPVLLAASQWKKFSGLVAFPTIGPIGKTINQVESTKEGWAALKLELEPVIKELTRNHQEKNRINNLPINPLPAPWEDAPTEIVPFPKWFGWVLLALLFFYINWGYTRHCTRKNNPPTIRSNPPQDEFRRANPMAQPAIEIPVKALDSIVTRKN